MTVKVVSDKPVRTRKVVCTKCSFELEYTGEDVKSYDKRDYSGDLDTYYYIECPRCSKQVFVRAWP